MKVIFAGTPEFAATALESLIQAGFDIPLVLTQPDRPAGRGMQLQASAVKQLAHQHHIPVAQPTSLKLNGKYAEEAQAAHDLLKETEHDVMVVAAYGLILPLSVLNIPRLGCLNIHASLLPRWRGAAPIHRAIEAGDTETGITIMQMNEGLDTGDMLLKQSLPIQAHDTTQSLHDTLAKLGGDMIVRALHTLKTQTLQPTPQTNDGVCYAEKIKKEEAQLDFSLSAETLDRKIRALNPFPICSAQYEGTSIKITQARVVQHASQARQSGEIVSAHAEQGIIVACDNGKSFLQIVECQKPGGKRLNHAAFLQGFPMTVGKFFQ